MLQLLRASIHIFSTFSFVFSIFPLFVCQFWMCEQPPPAKRPTFAVHDESPASRVQPAPATLSQHPANASRKPHIAVLPDDVVELILGWLPTRSRLRAMACCRRWYRIGWYSTYLWRILDLTSEEGVFVSLRHDAVQNVARRIQILQLVAARCIDAAESVTVRSLSIHVLHKRVLLFSFL